MIYVLTVTFACWSLQYITTVIPYHQGNGPPSNPTVQVLIKSKLPFHSTLKINNTSQ